MKALEDDGAVVYRGAARIVGRGRVEVTHDGTTHELEAANVVVAVGSTSKVPPIEGLAEVQPWTNEQATLARELPRSLLVLGGGPTGCEIAQVFARFGVPVTIVQSGPRLVPMEHPRNAESIRWALEHDGVTVKLGVRALQAMAGAGTDGAHVIVLDDGSTAEGHVVLLAVGRDFPVHDLGLEHYDVATRGPDAYPRDGRLRIADGLWIIGDAAGPELHTHQGHYQGEMTARMAMGEAVAPDYRALPRATYMDPEAASVGLSLGQAREAGLDAFECVAPFPTTAKGYSVEAETGHVTIVVDRGVAAARRGGDGLPGRVRGHPRVRARDQGAGADRRPRRHDPRLPVDVADLQRAVRRGAGDPRRPQPGHGRPLAPRRDRQARRYTEPAATSPSTSTSRGRACHSAPPTSTGSSSAAAGSTTTSARWPGTSRPRSRSPADSAGSTHAARSERQSEIALPGPSGATPAGHDGAARVTAHATPGPRVDRLDRRVRSRRDERPGGRDRPERIGPGVGAVAPQPARLLRVAADVDGLERRGDAQRGEPRHVVRVDELRVLDPRHERRRADGRAEDVERGADRRVADPVDLGRDPERRGPRRLRLQHLGRREPHAVPAVRRLGLAGATDERLEQGRRA